MTTVIIHKELTKEKDLIAVPRPVYEEFLVWQKRAKAVKTYTPTPAEKKMLAKARRNFASGNYFTWEEVKHELELNT